MNKQQYDFGGWATKNDLLCADGRTIRKDAFKDDDGRTVPLVYQHNHEDPTRVIGHALLKNLDDGVFAYCSLNRTNIAQHVKECVRHGDINGLSIFANKLVQRGGDVIHGVIRELSVVLSGANPGAVIEFPLLAHGIESETEAYIWSGEESLEFGEGMSLKHFDDEDDDEEEEKEVKETEPEAKKDPEPEVKEEPQKEPEIEHAEKEEPTKEKKPEEKPAEKEEKEKPVQDVINSMNDKQKDALKYLLDKAAAMALGEDDEDEDEEDDEESKDDTEVSHADSDDSEDGETIKDILDTMTEEQRKVVDYLVDLTIATARKEKLKHSDSEEEDKDDSEEDKEEVIHSEEEGENGIMKKNVFDNTAVEEQQNDTLTHAQMDTLIKDAKRLGSMRASVLEHSAEYGIEQIDWLFPDAKNLQNPPSFIMRDMGWVSTVMNGTSHTPFTRIKTMFADITEDEARARGYIKGKQKKNEVFTLLKRTTDPQTIYKKQKLDRDDTIDITDFDVVAWMKQEMRTMLNEEIARAILIGDGRDTDSDDHISEDHVRSVFRDEALFVVRRELADVQGEAKAKTLIKTVRKAWKDYKGSGNAIAFMTEEALSDLLLLEDGLGHFMYPTKEVAANVLGVREIVTVPPMADASTVRTDSVSHKTYAPLAIILNLRDYNVGADKGGSVNMFEDFDIDYNAMKYLIETRCSGALIRPYSAIVIEEEVNPT